MSKRKIGLQKRVSAIFDGVSIPKQEDGAQPSDSSAPERPDFASGKPFAPSHFTATVPETEKPADLQPKDAPVKETKESKGAVVIMPAEPSKWQQSLEQIKAKLFAHKPGVSSSRQKAMIILVPVLFIVFISVLVWVFGTGSGKPSRSPKPTATKSVAAVDKIAWQKPAAWPEGLRDPMQFGSIATTVAGTATLVVKGIVYSQNEPSALVGTEIVRQGDEVSGATVIKINKESVEFEMNGERWTQQVQR
ncbi:MAG: hypothetical protein ACYS0I_06690 [Planctomycetota bacterium]|jgi:hypothetical protein